MNSQNRHPAGERQTTALVPAPGPVAVDTFGGRVHVEWDPRAAVTPLGQLPFFTEFLQVSDLFDPWVESCPLALTSPNAPTNRDVLGTAVLHLRSATGKRAPNHHSRSRILANNSRGLSRSTSAPWRLRPPVFPDTLRESVIPAVRRGRTRDCTAKP